MRTLGVCLLACLSCFAAADKTVERLDDSATLISEIMETPDRSIPQDLFDKAECVVVVPGVKKAAFIVGAKYGRGWASCRNNGAPGWGAPAAVRVEGGSFGLQIGGSSTDVILLVMNERGMQKLLTSKFTLGGDASVAGGPVGRSASAQTDALMTAEILSWSRSKGVFAGLSLEGATLRNDLDENEALYTKKLTNKEVINGNLPVPDKAKKLVDALNKYSMKKG